MQTIYFDMDGTIADLYGVPDWLPKLRAYDASPYEEAAPMLRLCTLARLLNKLQKQGYLIGIISWLSKTPTPAYDMEVSRAKWAWLDKHMPSVEWDQILIIPHGQPKSEVAFECGILFDDEAKNREDWMAHGGIAYDETCIIEVLKSL